MQRGERWRCPVTIYVGVPRYKFSYMIMCHMAADTLARINSRDGRAAWRPQTSDRIRRRMAQSLPLFACSEICREGRGAHLTDPWFYDELR
jgi:hypothetical protein